MPPRGSSDSLVLLAWAMTGVVLAGLFVVVALLVGPTFHGIKPATGWLFSVGIGGGVVFAGFIGAARLILRRRVEERMQAVLDEV